SRAPDQNQPAYSLHTNRKRLCHQVHEAILDGFVRMSNATACSKFKLDEPDMNPRSIRRRAPALDSIARRCSVRHCCNRRYLFALSATCKVTTWPFAAIFRMRGWPSAGRSASGLSYSMMNTSPAAVATAQGDQGFSARRTVVI